MGLALEHNRFEQMLVGEVLQVGVELGGKDRRLAAAGSLVEHRLHRLGLIVLQQLVDAVDDHHLHLVQPEALALDMGLDPARRADNGDGRAVDAARLAGDGLLL